MELKLSIAIPTFGAPNAISDNLKRLLKCNRNDIEILIVDNDETGTQLKNIISSITDRRLKYYKNDKNIGRNNNIARALELARADYVLLLSSDDELYMDALDEVLETINSFPRLGIILGTIINSIGQTGFKSRPAGIYKKGYEAFVNLPFLGDLMPMVINKTYIDLNKCYDQNESYMQNRLALYAAGKGDLIYLKNKMGYMIASEDIHRNPNIYEAFANGTYSVETWDLHATGYLYYSHMGRITQLKQYLSIIDEFDLRLNQRMFVIEYWTSKMLANALMYVLTCRNPVLHALENQELQGVYSYSDVLNAFEYEMSMFFAKREAEGKYFFLGRLRDMIKNEIILINQAKMILQDVTLSSSIGVIGKDSIVSEKLCNLLELIGYKAVIVSLDDQIANMLVLIPRMYDQELDQKLRMAGVRNIHYMDRMAKYLGIAWCSEHPEPEFFTDYDSYV